MADRRRILLAEVTPKIPQATIPCTWSPTDKHADIALSGGNLTATKSTIDASNWACVRGTVPMRAGQWYWETRYDYTGTADLSCGIASADIYALTRRPGAGPGRFEAAGGPNRNGECLVTGGVIPPGVGAVPSGTVIRHWLDMDGGRYRVAKADGLWVDVDPNIDGVLAYLRRRGGIIPIAGFLRPSGSTVSVTANFGQSPFAYTPPDGANAGVYSTPDPIAQTIYLGSEGFNTGTGDTPASTHYMGRIAGDQDVEVEREGSCWVWGGNTVSRRGQVVCINADGGIDPWIDYDWRDAPIALYAGFEGDARSAFTLWSKGIVDTIEFTPDRRVRLALADPLALLDRAAQPTLYPDDQANPQLAGKPLPIVIGRPLYCEPLRLSASALVRDYQVRDDTHDGYGAELTRIDAVYDKGDVFKGPDDPYIPNNPITLANGGNFTTWANDSAGVSMPAGFTRITQFTANDQFRQNTGLIGMLQMLSSGQLTTAIYHSASTLLGGYRYTIQFTVKAVGKAGTLVFFAGDATQTTTVEVPITTGGLKTVTFDCPVNAQLQLLLGRTELNATIDDLTVSPVQIVDWSYWPSNSTRRGLTLANTPSGKVVCNPVGASSGFGVIAEKLRTSVAIVLARHAAAAGAALPIDSATLDAFGGAADYRVATYVTQPTTFLKLLRDLMDSWCGWIVPKRDGTLAAGRAIEPSNTSALTLDPTNIMGDIAITTDAAKGLSIVLGGRRNHSVHTDADIATSVPPALAAELKTELTRIRTGATQLTTAPVSSAYVQAMGAPPKATLLQDDADLQAEANRIATLWRPRRMFYSVTALLGASAADALEPGQTVRLVWPRYGLAGGKNLLVVGVRSRFFSRRVDLKLWG